MALKLSVHQFRKLEQIAAREFHRDLDRFLRAEFPEESDGISFEDMANFILVCEERCVGYGMISDASISQFACLSLASGIYVDDIPEIRSFLESTEVPPADKMDLLVESAENWA